MNETDYKTQDNALLRNIHAEGITLWRPHSKNYYEKPKQA
jgi:hypothetical protein